MNWSDPQPALVVLHVTARVVTGVTIKLRNPSLVFGEGYRLQRKFARFRADTIPPYNSWSEVHTLSKPAQYVHLFTHGHTETHMPWAVFAVGTLVWNSLPDYLRDPAIGRDTFTERLKTFMFASY